MLLVNMFLLMYFFKLLTHARARAAIDVKKNNNKMRHERHLGEKDDVFFKSSNLFSLNFFQMSLLD